MNYNSIDIKNVDLEHSFFHYTNINNLESIFKNGLEPRIGANSLYLEKSSKIFFVKGEMGIIDIMDVWLKWLTAKSNVNKFIYWIGTTYMRFPLCIKSLPNLIVKKNLNNVKKRHKIYNNMKNILDDSVFLKLDLEENVDFDYNDIDEVKERYYDSFLKMLYTKNSNLQDKRMEYWNMHTKSNRWIEKEKIQILCYDSDYKASILLKYLIEKNMEYAKKNCPFLNEYYNYIYK